MASYGTAHIMVWYGAVRQTTAQQDGVYHIHTTTYFVYVTYLVEFSCMSELFVFHISAIALFEMNGVLGGMAWFRCCSRVQQNESRRSNIQ